MDEKGNGKPKGREKKEELFYGRRAILGTSTAEQLNGQAYFKLASLGRVERIYTSFKFGHGRHMQVSILLFNSYNPCHASPRQTGATASKFQQSPLKLPSVTDMSRFELLSATELRQPSCAKQWKNN